MEKKRTKLDRLLEDKLVYYIYQLDPSIYGLESTPQYLVVTENNHMDELSDLPKDEYPCIIPIDMWFNNVKNGKIVAWKCACLNKKFIKKEHVKLLMQTNPLQLRKEIDDVYNVIIKNFEDFEINDLFDFVADTVFAIQIINNHKIVNFKSPARYYGSIPSTLDEFKSFYNPIHQELVDLTDGVRKKTQIEKALAIIEQREKDELEKEKENEENKTNDVQRGSESTGQGETV